MRRPFTQLFLHLVWSTWDRLPLIRPEIEPRLYGAMVADAEAMRCKVLAYGGEIDHVHFLLRLPTTVCVADLVMRMKGASSHLMNHQIAPKTAPDGRFKWQGAYGAFTVNKSGVPDVLYYVRNQKLIHAKRKLIKELEQCEEGDGE
jgi:putative transposase